MRRMLKTLVGAQISLPFFPIPKPSLPSLSLPLFQTLPLATAKGFSARRKPK